MMIDQKVALPPVSMGLVLALGHVHAEGTLLHKHRWTAHEQVFAPTTILNRLALILNIYWHKQLTGQNL